MPSLLPLYSLPIQSNIRTLFKLATTEEPDIFISSNNSTQQYSVESETSNGAVSTVAPQVENVPPWKRHRKIKDVKNTVEDVF